MHIFPLPQLVVPFPAALLATDTEDPATGISLALSVGELVV